MSTREKATVAKSADDATATPSAETDGSKPAKPTRRKTATKARKTAPRKAATKTPKPRKADRNTGGDPADAESEASSAKPSAAAKTDVQPTPSATQETPADKDAMPAGSTSADAAVGQGPRLLMRMPMMVRWRDLDAFNHVNNAKYLTYLEEARLHWMMALPGLGLDEDVAPVVAAAHLNYRRPIEWPGDVAIELFVERLGNTSVSLGHRIVASRDDGIVYCDGHVVLVWIDRHSGKAAPLPPGVREACQP